MLLPGYDACKARALKRGDGRVATAWTNALLHPQRSGWFDPDLPIVGTTIVQIDRTPLVKHKRHVSSEQSGAFSRWIVD